MSDLTANVSRIKLAAEVVGFPSLAQRAGVPYTTLKSFANRGWTNKNIEVFERLAKAAEQVLQELEDLVPAE